MPDRMERDPVEPLAYARSSTPGRPAIRVGLATASLAVATLSFIGGTFIANGAFTHYADVAAKARVLNQRALQADAAATAASTRPQHRALTPAEADAAIAYIDSLRRPFVNSSRGPISDAQRQTLVKLMTTPGQVVFDPETSPRMMPVGGRGEIYVNLSLRGNLYIDLRQGTDALEMCRFHGIMNVDGTFEDGPEILDPTYFHHADANRLRGDARAPDGRGSSVGEAGLILGVTLLQLALLIVLAVAGVLLLRAPPLGVRLHRIYAVAQLPTCALLAAAYAYQIEQTAPVPLIFSAFAAVPSLCIGAYALATLFVLRKAPADFSVGTVAA